VGEIQWRRLNTQTLLATALYICIIYALRMFKKAHLRRSYSTGMEIAIRWPSPRRILWPTSGNPFCLTTVPCPVAYAAPAGQPAACWLRHRRPRRRWPYHAIAPPQSASPNYPPAFLQNTNFDLSYIEIIKPVGWQSIFIFSAFLQNTNFDLSYIEIIKPVGWQSIFIFYADERFPIAVRTAIIEQCIQYT